MTLAACSTATSTPSTPRQQITSKPAPTSRPIPDFADLAQEQPPPLAALEFATDFSRHSVSYSEIYSGGPPRDGIRPIDHPQFVSVTEADSWLEPQEPVVTITLGDVTRAYPIQVLILHEIVNDELGGTPVLITFCPLCNTAMAFDRRLDGKPLDFSTTGRLRLSNLILYDRQTESWWQQATGEAIVGEYTGRQLSFLPVQMVGWAELREAFPDAEVLSRETGYARRYGENPFPDYDDIGSNPFLYEGHPINGRLPAMARVLTLEIGSEAVAYPYAVLEEIGVANDKVSGLPVAVFWLPGAASPLDEALVPAGRTVGSLAAYERTFNGTELNFIFENGAILDQQTGSRWNIFGKAVGGVLEGVQLMPLTGINHFWFSWAGFKPDTRIFEPDGEIRNFEWPTAPPRLSVGSGPVLK